MSPLELSELKEKWELLTANLDFHCKKWYTRDDDGSWIELTEPVAEVLLELGVSDCDQDAVKRQFAYRDGEAHARPYQDLRRAQLRLGL